MNKMGWTYQISVHNTESVGIRVFRPDGTEAGDYPPLPFQSEVAVDRTNLNDRAAIRKVGERLFQALLGDGKSFLATYQKVVVDDRQPLQVVLEINEEALPEEFAKPWELLCVPNRQPNPLIWLATTSGLSFCRRLYDGQPRPLRKIQPDQTLKVALMVSRPAGKDIETGLPLGQFDAAQVEDELSYLQTQGSIDLIRLSSKNIRDKLKAEQPHIFHFIGHGRLQDGTGQLAFVIESAGPLFGKPDWKTAEDVATLFSGEALPQGVILQACEGAKQSESDAFASVASKLLLQGIPIVIAMQHEIPAGVANQFVCRLYEEMVVKRNPIDRAVQEARYAIAQDHQCPDFATPVIYMNVVEGQLFAEVSESMGSSGGGSGSGTIDLKAVLKPGSSERKAVSEIIARSSKLNSRENRENFLYDCGLEEFVSEFNLDAKSADFASSIINNLLRAEKLDLFLSHLLEVDKFLSPEQKNLLKLLSKD